MADPASTEPTRGRATPELLLRDGRPEDVRDLGEHLVALGLTRRHLDLWEAGGSAVLLYDPVDSRVRGAGVAREIAPGTFEVVAVVVSPEVTGRGALEERVVRAVGDRIRRSGGERLVVPTTTPGLAESTLAAIGSRSEVTAGADGSRCFEL